MISNANFFWIIKISLSRVILLWYSYQLSASCIWKLVYILSYDTKTRLRIDLDWYCFANFVVNISSSMKFHHFIFYMLLNEAGICWPFLAFSQMESDLAKSNLKHIILESMNLIFQIERYNDQYVFYIIKSFEINSTITMILEWDKK